MLYNEYMNIPTNYFLYINIALIVIYLICMIYCYFKGLLVSILTVVFGIASAIVAWIFSPVFAEKYALIHIPADEIYASVSPIVNGVIWFIIIFLAVRLFGLLITPIFNFLHKIPLIGTLDKIGGLLLGFIDATVIALLFSFVLSTPLFINGQEVREETYLNLINDLSDQAISFLSEKIPKNQIPDVDVDAIREQFAKFLEEQDHS